MTQNSNFDNQVTQNFSILGHLKNKTATHHQIAEKKNLAKHIIDHTITTDQYKELLKKNYRVYSAVETYLDTNKNLLCSNLQSFISLEKSKALKKDLDTFSIDLTPISDAGIGLPANVGSLTGALYVMEGSMLGGLLIAKHLKKCRNLSSNLTHHFFEGNPEYHTRRWKSLCKILENRSYTQEEINTATHAAIKVFESFY